MKQNMKVNMNENMKAFIGYLIASYALPSSPSLTSSCTAGLVIGEEPAAAAGEQYLDKGDWSHFGAYYHYSMKKDC